ncbi:MAG: hypothetical protein FJX76_14685 [Armatimonadetes bacterium]|nr:hypothetical protein [Armatimonadota bacterium]
MRILRILTTAAVLCVALLVSGARAADDNARFEAWLKSAQATMEILNSVQQAADALGKGMLSSGWLARPVPPYANFLTARIPEDDGRLPDESLLKLAAAYEKVATVERLERVGLMLGALEELPVPTLSREQLARVEETIGYSRFSGLNEASPQLLADALRGELFGARDDRAIRETIEFLRQNLGSEARKAVVEQFVEATRRAYESRSDERFMRLVSPNYEDTTPLKRGRSALESSVAADFQNMQDIRLTMRAGSPKVVGGVVSVTVNWSRRALVEGKEWVVDKKRGVFVFEVNDRKMSLLRVDGATPYGVSDSSGALAVTEGKLEGRPIKPAAGTGGPGPTTIGPTRSGVATVRLESFGSFTAYRFEGNREQTGLSKPEAPPGADLLFTIREGELSNILIGSGAGAPAGIAVLSVPSMSAVKMVTASMQAFPIQESAAALMATGQVLAVRTADGKYAKLQILHVAIHQDESPVGEVKFRWEYQPDGSPAFP